MQSPEGKGVLRRQERTQNSRVDSFSPIGQSPSWAFRILQSLNQSSGKLLSDRSLRENGSRHKNMVTLPFLPRTLRLAIDKCQVLSFERLAGKINRLLTSTILVAGTP